MNLNNRPAIDARWIASVQPTLSGFLNCQIELYDMNLDEAGADYNWATNEGFGATRTLLYSGEAQLQVYRFTLTMDAPAGSVDQVRNVRFTVNKEEISGVDVRKGQMIFVTSCENDPALTRFQYVVNSGLNSGASFRRTIECEVDMARVI